MFVDGLQPLLCVLKALAVCKIKSYDDSISIFVELIRQVLKSLLASGVPKLDFYFVSFDSLVNLNEIESDCPNVRSLELALIEPLEY